MHIDLQFIKSWGAYNVGEVARFAKQQAHTLIERGVALERTAVKDVEKTVTAVLGDKPAGADAPEAGAPDALKAPPKVKST